MGCFYLCCRFFFYCFNLVPREIIIEEVKRIFRVKKKKHKISKPDSCQEPKILGNFRPISLWVIRHHYIKSYHNVAFGTGLCFRISNNV